MAYLSNAAFVDAFQARPQEGLEKCLQVFELARGVDNTRWEMSARVNAVGSLISLGKLEDAREHATILRSLAENIRTLSAHGNALTMNIMVARAEGDWPFVIGLL